MRLTELLDRARIERRKSRNAQTRAYLEITRARRISLHTQSILHRFARLRERRATVSNISNGSPS